MSSNDIYETELTKSKSRIKCTNESVDARLLEQGRTISRLGLTHGVLIPITWQCNTCNYTWEATPKNVITTGSGCPKCNNRAPLTNESVDVRLIEMGDLLKREGNVVNSTTKIEWQCNTCHKLWSASPDGVINHHTTCPFCTGRALLTNKIIDMRLLEYKRTLFRISNVINSSTNMKWQCNVCNHIWQATPAAVVNRFTGCPLCSCNNKGGFNGRYFTENPHMKSANSLLYLIEGEFDNRKFLKIGITTRTLQSRFKEYQDYNIKEITSKPMLLFDAYTTEQSILNHYQKYKKLPSNEFIGKTECFIYDETIRDAIVCNYFLTNLN